MSSQEQQVVSADVQAASQEPEVVLNNTSEVTPKTKVEIPPRVNSDSEERPDDDGVVRVSNKEGKMRASIGYLMSRLNEGHTTTLQAYGQAVTKAILISSIVRTKIGGLHQVTHLCEMKDDKRESQGVRIVLSKEPPQDTAYVGYQVAEPKGFWQRKRNQKPKKAETERSVS